MEKRAAKVFKKHGKGRIKVLKNYRAKSFEQGKKTTAIKGSRLDLNNTIADIMLGGSNKEREIVAECLIATYREDWEEGKVIKY